MFGWFQPRCPVGPEEKAWIENRMRWLGEQFGLERLREAAVVEPTPEFFPDPYDGSEEAVWDLLGRVCGYMEIDPGRVELAFYSEANRPQLIDEHGRPLGGSAGLYQEGETARVWIELSQLADPTALVATCAHELCHLLLLGEGRISPEAEDHEPLTDLLTVFLGLGIFPANSTVREAYWTAGQWSGWSIGRQGYLTQLMFAHAFALFAWARGEEDPAWADHLRPDVRSPFKKGLRYLWQTGDSLFKPQ